MGIRIVGVTLSFCTHPSRSPSGRIPLKEFCRVFDELRKIVGNASGKVSVDDAMVEAPAEIDNIARLDNVIFDDRLFLDAGDGQDSHLRVVDDWGGPLASAAQHTKVAEGDGSFFEFAGFELIRQSSFFQIFEGVDEFSERKQLSIAEDRNDQPQGRSHGDADIVVGVLKDFMIFHIDGCIDDGKFLDCQG